MKFTYNNFCSIDCNITDIIAFHSIWKEDNQYNYELQGRNKYLIFYQLENGRNYFRRGEHICTINKHDILFLPHGTRYTSAAANGDECTSGIGISFNIRDQDGNVIESDEDIKIICHDSDSRFYNMFKKILFSVLHPSTNSLKLKAELFDMLDKFFSEESHSEGRDKIYDSIAEAISTIESSPEENYSNKELANMCFLSESSFVRKFKQYSGGKSPLQYRNQIRLMRAEELVNTSKTIDQIASLLGFYDGSHLCRLYKKMTGHTLKKKL